MLGGDFPVTILDGVDGSAELVYRSLQTEVWRVRPAADNRAYVCKKGLHADAVAQIGRERQILGRLADVEGVPRLAPTADIPGCLMTLDVGGTPLADVMRREQLSVATKLDIAVALAGIVAALHRRGVLHRDINPSNIILSGPQRRVTLIDFGLATMYAQDGPSFTHYDRIAGTVAYIAPEQTGRTGRRVDARSDLYSIGATLYEVATAHRPFERDDLTALVYDHIATTPRAPLDLAPHLPTMLSAVIMRLLEKEPDRRYQGADGLLVDLLRVRADVERGSDEVFALAEHDFPSILQPPSTLIGRDDERAALCAAFERARQSPQRVVVICGPEGVGKTVLADELRPVVTRHGGWFAKGRYDGFGVGSRGGIFGVIDALGQLLLAESEAELATHRERIEAALGGNRGLVASLSPQFGIILGPQPELDAHDILDSELRLRQSIVDLLRAVVQPTRPLVLVIDDMQWAGANALSLLDGLVNDQALRGVLLVCIFRADGARTEPLGTALQTWARDGALARELRLANLPARHVNALLCSMLRLSPARAEQLGNTVIARTAGNPFDTIDFINALRRDGTLVLGKDGWNWDEAAVRRYVGTGEVIDQLAARIACLPESEREILAHLACLGGAARIRLIERAAGVAPTALLRTLEASLEDGLVVLDPDHGLRFVHDRVRTTVYGDLAPSTRAALHLSIARRLAGCDEAAFEAAEQYLFAEQPIADPTEARVVANLFCAAAAAARRAAAFATAERYLSAALALLEPIASQDDPAAIFQLRSGLHGVLYCLARYDEADGAFAWLERNAVGISGFAATAGVQVCSLANRGRQREAVELGVKLLPSFGVSVPQSNVGAEVARGLAALRDWIDADMPVSSAARETDPLLEGASHLIARISPSAFFYEPLLSFWLSLELFWISLDRGCPDAHAAGIVGNAICLIALAQDYRRAFRFAQYVVAAADGGHEPDASRTRHVYALTAAHWGRPLEESIPIAHQARERLLRVGDVQFACFTYFAALPALLDCAETIAAMDDEFESAISFATRTNSASVASAYASYRWLTQALRGAADGSADDGIDDPSRATAVGSAVRHINLALGALILNDTALLCEHSAAALEIGLPAGFYVVSTAYLVRGCALARTIRASIADELQYDAEAAELDTCITWLTERAADAPANFAHLTHLLQAERARALGDAVATAQAFERALQAIDGCGRPWQAAFITESAAAFYLETGLGRSAGRELMADARRRYAAWGATEKVRQLEEQHPFLRALHPAQMHDDTATVRLAAIDLLAILRVSQALSSETNLDRLRMRIVESLREMTGAGAVHVVFLDAAQQTWFVWPHASVGPPLRVDDDATAALCPLSAFRYAARTRVPLLVDDAVKDDRFANDRYIARLTCCSLLVVPILSQNVLRAVLVLENRLTAGAFTTDRLEAVTLLAGQLSVSLDNASVYALLEHKVAERTAALQVANERLEVLSTTDALTGLPNRRRLVEFLERAWVSALQTNESIAIAIADVDHFKLYNDRYGHVAGDACLQLVAATMSGHIRAGVDLIARYGGEEFAIVLPAADLTQVGEVIARVREAVAALAEPHAGAERGIVTVSIGAAVTLPSRGDGSVEQLIAAADVALYEAKANGRNCSLLDAGDLTTWRGEGALR